jgi:hypothetical protein
VISGSFLGFYFLFFYEETADDERSLSIDGTLTRGEVREEGPGSVEVTLWTAVVTGEPDGVDVDGMTLRAELYLDGSLCDLEIETLSGTLRGEEHFAFVMEGPSALGTSASARVELALLSAGGVTLDTHTWSN